MEGRDSARLRPELFFSMLNMRGHEGFRPKLILGTGNANMTAFLGMSFGQFVESLLLLGWEVCMLSWVRKNFFCPHANVSENLFTIYIILFTGTRIKQSVQVVGNIVPVNITRDQLGYVSRGIDICGSTLCSWIRQKPAFIIRTAFFVLVTIFCVVVHVVSLISLNPQ